MANAKTEPNIVDLFQYQIKYDDLTRGEHRIDLNELGKSLQGFATVFSTVGTYVITNKLPEKTSEYKVQIFTDAKIKEGSAEIIAFISAAIQALGDISTIKEYFDVICAFIFSKREQSDMDRVLEYLKTRDAIDLEKEKLHHEETMETIKSLTKLADSSIKNSLSSIGNGCKTIQLSSGLINEPLKVISNIDSDIKRVIYKKDPPKEEASQNIEILIYSLNKKTANCNFYQKEQVDKYELDDSIELTSYSGKITDPNFELPLNAYTTAFSNDSFLKVVAKVKHNQNGDVYYISDVIPNKTEE
ncbi:hypothetical protein SAMN04487865_1001108 [Succinivibrio dextrinosolvens]|uniref:Uncharacterized protein n=1 Tax=Succinivibrio dextrinosolvens TaxID=83771 RepID=A0A662Z7Q0_9GAMM|nr:hypothetical protein [Succinivibrio dextrinosolvens]SFJ74071.1 hypothetical protein SAMN04487865_1001108 [Succinivibrio dextrinosolvens]